MDHSAVFSAIDRLYPDYLDMLRRMCDIESPTCDKAAVDSACSFVADWGRALGFEVEVFPDPSAGDVVAITMKGRNTAPLVLSGHMDTVHPRGLFGEPPTRIQGGRIIGPGVTDCKGGVALCMLAMAALKSVGWSERTVKLILQTDEEVGSTLSCHRTIDRIVELSLGAVAFLNTEGMQQENTAVLRRKGILRYRFSVKGRAAHSSRCFEGSNAIAECAHKIIELEKLKDDQGITCNCGIISGGTVANTVAEECSFVADVRFADEEQAQRVEKLMKEIAEKTFVDGCSCTLVPVSYRPPMPLCDRNLHLLDSVNSILSSAGLDPLIGGFGVGGSDAAYTTLAGIPTIDNLGIGGDLIHSSDEYALCSSLALGAKRIAAIAMAL